MKEIIRVGKVSSVDYAAGKVRVFYPDKDGCVTKPLPMLNFRYFMPEVDDWVYVLHLPNGTETGLVLGKYFNNKNMPKESGKGLFRVDFDHEGDSFMRFLKGIFTLKSKEIIIKGDITSEKDVIIKGNLTVEGKISAKHITATEDIIVNAPEGVISLKNHKHGESTEKPKPEGGGTVGN